MQSKLIRFGLVVGALMLAIAAAPAFAGSDSRDGNGPSVQGVVSDVSGTTVKLLNGLITVDAGSAAIVSENNNLPLALADIKVGEVIQVEGTMIGQLIHATKIQVHGPKSDGTIQGPIDGVDQAAGRFSVLGLTIAITPATVFDGNNGAVGSVADLAAGKFVDVEVAVFQGGLVATRISPDGADSQSETND